VIVKRGSHEREERRKRMQGDNLVMLFWAKFSPESCLATGPMATMILGKEKNPAQ